MSARPATGAVVLEGRGLSRDYSARRGMFSPPATVKALADALATIASRRAAPAEISAHRVLS